MPPPPPPPPPLPSGNLPSQPPAGNRSALLSDISRGKPLKKVTTNDRSAPIISNSSRASVPSLPLSSAPPIPGSLKTIEAPSLPPVPASKQLRSNVSKNGEVISGNSASSQLAGLFSGGIPKLKKREGGVDTGANSSSIYTSETESSQFSSQKFPQPATRPLTGVTSRPRSQNGVVSPTFGLSASNLRNTVTNTTLRPFSAKGPPPPVGKKPPVTHPGPRKSSGFQVSASVSSTPPSTLPPPPPPAPPRISLNSNSRILPPPASHPNLPSTNGMGQNLAIQAAIRAAGHSSPSIPIPPPISRPPPPAPQTITQTSASSFSANSQDIQFQKTIGTKSKEDASTRHTMHDPRWKFRDHSMLPKPREFLGLSKKYRAGRGSSVPLDFSSFH
ncbi:hypothetical protein HI914_01820 [Erysiphe necator]|uniref:Putative wasp-interacting protein vrp1p n=1 Tax=Uncinula necator TaxID=52586 RepID=A0A0B1P0G2_UNCNE|nr:hypothetical protein HI914_01820 [Erysiphe necator]KHJ30775.1 putative wasp-interacting protein vrp1p [Erysiphe necator]